jgi:DME family drug/metabolite transporter
VGWVVLAALLWSSVGPLSRLALASGLPPLDVALGRALVAAACFGVHAVASGGAAPARRDAPALVAFAAIGVAGLFAMNQLAVAAGGAALATILLYTAPIWVTAAAPLLGERVRARAAVAAVTAAGGIAVLAAGGGGVRATPPALLWGLGSGAAYALYSALGKRLVRRAAPETVFALALPIAAAALVALGARPSLPPARQAAPVIAIGLLSYGASLAYARGLRVLPAARAAILATLEPIGAAILAFALFGERVAVPGAAIALVAIVAGTTGPGRRPPDRAIGAGADAPPASPARPPRAIAPG